MSCANIDNQEGLLTALESLEALNILARGRYLGGWYSRGGDLKRWALGGRWLLDSCGNVFLLRLNRLSRQEVAALSLPSVLTYSELDMELAKRELEGLSIDPKYQLPPHGSRCPHTGTEWSIDNAHLSSQVQISDFEWEVDERWEGKNWDEVSRPEVMEDNTAVRIAPKIVSVRGVDGIVRREIMQGDYHVSSTHIVQGGEALCFSKVHYVHVDSCLEAA